MSGSTPYTARSPTQSNQYPPYSPTHPNGPFYSHHEPYHIPSQHLIQTTPPFPPASLVQSPLLNRPSHLASPLSAPNSLPPPPLPPNSHYQVYPTSPSAPHLRSSSAGYPVNPMSVFDGTSTHAHPSAHSPPGQSAIREQHHLSNGRHNDSAPAEPRPVSQDKPDRASNPMSFASILGPSNNEVSPKPPPSSLPRPSTPPPKPVMETKKVVAKQELNSLPPVETNGAATNGYVEAPSKVAFNAPRPREFIAPSKPRKMATDAEADRILKALAQIDEATHDDVDVGFYESKELFKQRGRKRKATIEEGESRKKKRRTTYLLDTLIKSFDISATNGAHRFRDRFEAIAAKEIADKDHQSEKERKKDMQRKRRREQQIRNETQKVEELQERAREAEDQEEAQRYLKQAEKAQQRIKQTTELLEGGPAQEDMEVPAPLPNFEGGVTGAFQLDSPEPGEPPKKRSKKDGPSVRPKKSKAQKQAEKDAAEAGYAAMQEKEALVHIAPKEETKKETVSKAKKAKESKEAKEAKEKEAKEAAALAQTINYESKGYNQIYEQIWRDMARKDIPKLYRLKQLSYNTRQENLRKTVILASKQARKWQERTNKSMKDVQARAKRVMREMMSFWKRNEREERDLRRMAERKEIEDAKKAEADREANRQKRKLNFLISQTEIYSHFIGRKIKTDEIERATDDPDVAAAGAVAKPNAHNTSMDDISASDEHGNHKVTNFEDLDFDADDDSELRRAAMANAASALQDAQDKARNFNGDDPMAAFDESDMNFQNPTMAGTVQVTQPKMLQAQLKEYQLKGLNWLVNLYEQGINGILADEMGLGKTVQSISVMGYLAEQHNVWGPFLVIAPASTLHNWQQEVAKFVPTIKVLPYWGSAKDRKVLRKFWDRKHITYNKDSEFHVLVTSYQLVVQDAQYFQKIKWQYMILDEAQAIKSSSSSRWKALLAFQCRNRLLLTGTPIQNNMQELWALLHFIMPTLFDSHDEFSDWFSKDIESHAQSNTKLNHDQLKRLHMILKPFMLRRVKAHVQKELGDKIEKDVFCELTYRQRAYYANLRSKISIMDLIEKATIGDDQDTATLMNLVMQFRKVCNHPDLFERADTNSPFSMSYFAETASFLREGSFVQVGYSVRNQIQYDLPRILCNDGGRLDIAGPNNPIAGFRRAGCRTDKMAGLLKIWTPENIKASAEGDGAFSFLRFADTSAGEACDAGELGVFERAIKLKRRNNRAIPVFEDSEVETPVHAMFNIVDGSSRQPLAQLDPNSTLARLCSVSKDALANTGYSVLEPAAGPKASAPPIEISCFDQSSSAERQLTFFNLNFRNIMFPLDETLEENLLKNDVDPRNFPLSNLLPKAESEKAKFTHIGVPSMRRFVTDSGKLAKLDQLLRELKNGGHRVLLYFQMTRMINLMEEYLTYRNYKYCRLDGSTKLEDRRDTVHDFQTRPEIFIFLLSTRAGGLGINLTSADTVIFYDSDWNPTIDSQAMDRAHRLGQTKQVTVYRLITRGTIEERIRKRAMQKEEVQRVVITGGGGAGVDFNTRDRRENRTKDIAMWLADDDQAALIEQKESELSEKPEEEPIKKKSKKAAAAAAASRKRKGEMSLDDMYHEGEGHFEDVSAKPSGAATPVEVTETPSPKKGPGARGGKGISKKAKTAKQRLAIIDAEGDLALAGSPAPRVLGDEVPLSREEAAPYTLFRHTRLLDTKTQQHKQQQRFIRLVKVHTCLSSTGRIHCSIRQVSSHDLDRRRYHCLSYTWGPAKEYHLISLNGLGFAVRSNLWRFLCAARLVYGSGSGSGVDDDDSDDGPEFWIDALCIDQTNIDEVNHQIGLMNQIYSNAVDVIVWLGNGDVGRSSALEFLIERVEIGRKGAMGTCAKKKKTKSSLSSPLGLGSTGSPSPPREDWPEESVVQSLVDLCEDLYWGRTWIIQEVMLAKRVFLMSGTTLMPWSCLADFLIWGIEPSFSSSASAPPPGSPAADSSGEQDPHGPAKTQLWDSRARLFCMERMMSSGEMHQFSLRDLLVRFGRSNCSDVRDRVLGLLALADYGAARKNGEFKVDYSLSPAQLFAYLMAFYDTASVRNGRTLLYVLELDLETIISVPIKLDFQMRDEHVSTSLFVQTYTDGPRECICKYCGIDISIMTSELGDGTICCFFQDEVEEHLVFDGAHGRFQAFALRQGSDVLTDTAIIKLNTKASFLTNMVLNRNYRKINVTDRYGRNQIEERLTYWLDVDERALAFLLFKGRVDLMAID